MALTSSQVVAACVIIMLHLGNRNIIHQGHLIGDLLSKI